MWYPAPAQSPSQNPSAHPVHNTALGRSPFQAPLVGPHELQALLHTRSDRGGKGSARLRDGQDVARVPVRQDARQNRMLDALPEADLSALMPYLERVSLAAGQVIGQPGELAQQVFFPLSCTASLVSHTADGESAELALMGPEGVIGVTLVLGGAAMNHSVQVQSSGVALRMQAEVFMRQQAQRPALQQLALLYAQWLMGQMAQSIVCSRHHSVTQRLTHWVLSHADGQGNDALQVTHENISQMLGVRRESVTQAAGKLQAAGAIGNGRGKMLLKNREGLRTMACECYARSETDRANYLQQVAHWAELAAQGGQGRNRQGASWALWPKDGLQGGGNGDAASVTPTMPSAWGQDTHGAGQGQVPGTANGHANGHASGHSNGHVYGYPGGHAGGLRSGHGPAEWEDVLEADPTASPSDSPEAPPLAWQKYVDAYDFAPVGFVTLDAQGRIVQTNLAGAILLDIQRSQCQHSLFAHFLDSDSHATFQQFHQEVLGGKCRRHCEVILSATAHQPQRRVRIDATLDEDGQQCRLVLIDLS